MTKVIPGVNDLKTKFPDIAAEAYGWDPTTVVAGTHQKKDWKCEKGHIYFSRVKDRTKINERTGKGSGCPVCDGKQVLAGFNDLQSQFPDIAAEAYGWDPTTVTRSSNKKQDWKCKKEHIYFSQVASRTADRGGCPYCNGNQVLKGFNDLKTKFPDIAAEAYGWDPTTVVAGTHQKKDWKCEEGHIYFSRVNDRTKINERTGKGSGCPVCDGKQVLAGFNDLQSQFPDIAAEAYGWDPSTVVAGTHQKKDWKCREGHIYPSIVNDRTGQGSGCPTCSNKQVLVGFNDLQSQFPDIAAEAYGWDPSSVVAGTVKKKDWKCKEGHIYFSKVNDRTGKGSGCPFCDGKQVLAGFNDLNTKFPDIAKEAYMWDPSTIVAGTGQKKEWKCEIGHIWIATVSSRTSNGNGCPICAERGFNPEKDAWFYLMQRPGEQQLGISNVLLERLRIHERNGWTLLEHTIEGSSGKKVQEIEVLFKKWLKKEIGLMKGTTENWSTTKMEVQSLAELKARSGIETDLF